MKDFIFKFIKIVLPICIGLYICWYFWNSFDSDAKAAFFEVFKEADYFILSLSLLVGLFSHYARAKRWLYVLKPMGYKPSLFNSFNSIMIGYIMNILVPRMGEASRAGVLSATDGIPFEKGFGSIVTERFIDLVCLIIICGVALLINLDNLDDILMLADKVNSSNDGSANATSLITYITMIVLISGVVITSALWFFNNTVREKINKLFYGFITGLKSIFVMQDRGLYLLYTVLIWVAYVLMFWIPFYAWGNLHEMPLDGMLSAFIMGTVGFIIVQGGLGLYPIMVGIVITFYMNPVYIENNEQIAMPEHIGFGALLWVTQTMLVVVIGLFSFMMVRKAKKNIKNQESLSDSSSN